MEKLNALLIIFALCLRNFVAKNIKYLCLVLILSPVVLPAQFLSGDQEPPGINWKKIDAKHFQIIFPEEISRDALRVANTLEHEYQAIFKTLYYPFKKIPVLLTTNSLLPNGYAALAPRRTEWAAAPIQDGADDSEWYNLLASHEIRHIVQLDKMTNYGFNEIINFAFGEELVFVVSSLIVPKWFWEGDAVLSETTLGKGGRGRDPNFDIGIRTLLLSGKRYSYYKALMGSYSDYYPNHYPLGYLLVSHVRRNYDVRSWGKILSRTAFYSFYPFAFSNSLSAITGGKGVTEIYKDAMDEFKFLWQKQQEGLILTDARILNPKNNKLYTNYYYPQFDKNGSVIALRTGLADPQTLVRITSGGKEKEIRRIASIYPVSVGGGKIAWNEINFHPRWAKQNYADIVVYDIQSGKERTITQKGNFLTPSLSPDGSRIAAVEWTSERKCALVILDSESGEIIQRAPNPENETIKLPSWSDDGRLIVFTGQKYHGKGITIYDAQSDSLRNVIDNCWQGITYPVFYQNYILYNSFYSGIDNIYAVDIKSGQRYRVTSRPFGAYNPAVSPGGNDLLFNDYSVDGYDAAEMPLDTSKWIKIEDVEDRSLKYYEPLIAQEQGGTIYNIEDIPDVQYPIKDYNPLANIINFHSWEIYPDTLNLGIRFKSRDILNTTELGVGLYFNTNERSFGGSANLSYAGFYPIIDLSLSHLGRATTYKFTSGEKITDCWLETSATAGFRIPLNISKGIYRKDIFFGASASFTKVSKQDFRSAFEISNGNFMPVSYMIGYSRLQRSVRRDMAPRWGQVFYLIYRHTPFKGDYNGDLFAAQTNLYFPGLFKHHSLWFEGNYEIQNPDNYRFEAALEFPRGYRYIYHREFAKASVNYSLPLLYPDFSLGKWFYLKRIKTNLFYDYGIGRDADRETFYRSAGSEIMFDHQWLSFFLEFSAGYRYSYKLAEEKSVSEFVFRFLF
jgi:hypothetical protein